MGGCGTGRHKAGLLRAGPKEGGCTLGQGGLEPVSAGPLLLLGLTKNPSHGGSA